MVMMVVVEVARVAVRGGEAGSEDGSKCVSEGGVEGGSGSMIKSIAQ